MLSFVCFVWSHPTQTHLHPFIKWPFLNSIMSNTTQISWHQKIRTGISPMRAFSSHSSCLYSSCFIPSLRFLQGTNHPLNKQRARTSILWHQCCQGLSLSLPCPVVPKLSTHAQPACPSCPCFLPALSSLRNMFAYLRRNYLLQMRKESFPFAVTR